MSEYKIKLSSVMNFDEEREKDLIEQMEELKGCHKLGDFIAICVRICFENPILFSQAGYSLDSLSSKITKERENFFKSVDRQVREMQAKVDKVYDMAFKLHSLALFGKKLGLEEKSKQLLSSTFLLEKQATELSRLLGVGDITKVWESNKTQNVSEQAENILEYIIEAYDGIVDEIKASSQPSMDYAGLLSALASSGLASGLNKDDTVDSEDEQPDEEVATQESDEISLIDESGGFGDSTDWGALDKFIGM